MLSRNSTTWLFMLAQLADGVKWRWVGAPRCPPMLGWSRCSASRSPLTCCACHALSHADRAARCEAGSLYDEAASLAYAATRMPACYAALRRVLGEVAARRPGWRPETMLDFGAGPGAAAWAAQQVGGCLVCVRVPGQCEKGRAFRQR